MVNIQLHGTGKIGPAEYRAGGVIGANADVFDASGHQLSNGCYPKWVLSRGKTPIKRYPDEMCVGGGFSMFSSGPHTLDIPGTYLLSVSVVTDGGQKGAASVTIKVS
jgi:hypothetical protein